MYEAACSGPSWRVVGRAQELRTLRGSLDAAAGGRPSVVLIEGPAGSGKSALLTEFLQPLVSLVVRVVADEDDAEVPFAVLEQLLRVMDAQSPRLAPGADVVGAGTRLLDRLNAYADSALLVVSIDDAHWADAPSLDALAFTWRRLVNANVLLLLAARPADEDHPPLPPSVQRLLRREGGTHLRLTGLTAADIAEAAKHVGKPLSTPMAEALASHTGGLPLHVRTLIEDMTPADLALAGETPLPAPRSFVAAVEHRMSALAPSAIDLVEAAAVFGGPAPLGLLARMVDLSDPLPALDAAAGAGLLLDLAPGDTSVTFAHPLHRAAVYRRMTGARRSALHRRAAEVATDPWLRLRHRAAASPGADDALAAELADWASAEARQGGLGRAVAAYLAAHRVATPGPVADDFALRAADLMISIGNPAGAAAAVAQTSADGRLARRSEVAGTLALFGGRREEAERLLLEAWDRCGEGDREVAAQAASSLGALYVNQGRLDETITWTQRALAFAHGDDVVQSLPTTVHAIALAILGRYEEAEDLFAHLPSPLTSLRRADEDPLLARGILALWRDDIEHARRDLTTILTITRERGPAHATSMALYYVSDAEFRLGRWDEAALHGELALALAEGHGLEWTRAIAHAVASAPLAMRGEWAEARAHVEAAQVATAELADPAAALWTAVASARLDIARGSGEAMATLSPLWALRAAPALRQPAIQPWLPLYVEACLLAGRRAETEEALAALDETLVEPLPGPFATAARVRAALRSSDGDHRGAVSVLTDALARIEAMDKPAHPFEQAAVHLALGSSLRRAGRRRMAVDALSTAREAMAALGARPWLDTCDRELAACGVSTHHDGRGRRIELTAQELAVARLAAQGLSNRQIAAELIVSVKTIEYHLGNIYPKLGIRSRAAVATALADLSS